MTPGHGKDANEEGRRQDKPIEPKKRSSFTSPKDQGASHSFIIITNVESMLPTSTWLQALGMTEVIRHNPYAK